MLAHNTRSEALSGQEKAEAPESQKMTKGRLEANIGVPMAKACRFLLSLPKMVIIVWKN
jgi:hypothetical protein